MRVDGSERLVPTPNSGDNLGGISLPDEWARFLIVLFDEAVNGCLEIDDRVEDAVFQAPPGQLGKEPLDSIEP